MSKDKPGIFRRLFTWTGKLFTAFKWLINLVFVVIMISVLVSIFSTDVRPLPDKAPLRLVVSGQLVEERSFANPLTQLMEQSAPYDAETPIRELIDTLKKARDDNRITALLLDLNHYQGGGLAKLWEVGRAIEAFKESGKPVLAYADSYSQGQYYLASFADEIIVNPMGGVIFTGFGAYGTFYQEAAEKLKINFHVFRAGRFKSAVEPFTRNSMSEEARQNTRAWISPLWNNYTDLIESNRQLPEGTVQQLANNLPGQLDQFDGDLAGLALDKGLVDRVMDRTELQSELVQRFGADDKTTYTQIPHKEYLSHLRLPLVQGEKTTDNQIGFIVASGNIVGGEQMEGTIGGDSMSRLIRQAREDKTLKALVIRVDSPGGSAFASDVIRQEILKTRETMPVVISMGSLAASGGYWISAQANEIWAQPATLTGSIGVFGIIPTVEDSLAALGVYSDGVGTANLADYLQLDRPLSEDAAQVTQLSIDNVYRQFLSLVANGRDKTPAQIEEIAEGRIWTGEQARSIGLVDRIGDLDQALASAAAMANLDDWSVKQVRRPLSFQEQLLRQLSTGAAGVLSSLLPQDGLASAVLGGHRVSAGPLGTLESLLARYSANLQQLNDPRGAYLQCFGCPEL